VTKILEANGNWSVEQTADFKAPLAAGLKIVVDGALIDRNGDVACKLRDWRWRTEAPDKGNLELVVEEVKQSAIDRWYARQTDEVQFMVGGAIPVILVLTLLAVGYSMMVGPGHGSLWEFVGRYIRGVVGVAVVILFAAILPWRMGLLAGSPKLWHTFLSFLLTCTGLILMGVWLSATVHPANFGGTPAEYAAYAQGLAAKFSKSYWPYVLAALPWISLAFKTMGLSFAQGATDIFAKSQKGKAS